MAALYEVPPVKFHVVLIAAVTMAAGAARAETARCERLDQRPVLAIESLPPPHRQAAHSAREQAGNIATLQGSPGEPVLVRLESPDPKQAYLVAFVPKGDALTALVVHSTASGQTHSLVDADAAFVISMNQPEPPARRGATGTSYMFFDRHRYHIHISNSVTERTPQRYTEAVRTGYASEALRTFCRPRS